MNLELTATFLIYVAALHARKKRPFDHVFNRHVDATRTWLAEHGVTL